MIIQLWKLVILHNACAILWRHDRPYHNIEEYHYFNEQKSLNKSIKGVGTMWVVPPDHITPDFRLNQNVPPTVKTYAEKYADPMEENRPYRWSPPDRSQYQLYKKRWWYTNYEDLSHYGCYCCTVFRRLRPLAVGAVITSRHILTTATSTHLILRYYRHFNTLENILGAWYDHTDMRDRSEKIWNTTFYMTPARIHYHPLYTYPADVNISHPIPCMFDIAVWASTFRFFYEKEDKRTIICPRGGAGPSFTASSYPYLKQFTGIIGFQFIKWWRRNPTPWHRYVFRTSYTMENAGPCPKIEWGPFFCIPGPFFLMGLDSGAGMHVSHREYERWRYDGLVGIHSMTLKLRYEQQVHYFVVIDAHIVLNFIFDAYMGRQPYVFLDARFEDSEWRAPRLKPGNYIPWRYPRNEYNKAKYTYSDHWSFRYWK